MATLYRTNGFQEEVRPVNGRAFSIEEMQLLVGGFIQVVKANEPGMWIVCDECGKMRNPPKPVNVVASTLWCGLGYGDPLVGEILVGTAEEVGFNAPEPEPEEPKPEEQEPDDELLGELSDEEVKIMDDLKKLFDEGKL